MRRIPCFNNPCAERRASLCAKRMPSLHRRVVSSYPPTAHHHWGDGSAPRWTGGEGGEGTGRRGAGGAGGTGRPEALAFGGAHPLLSDQIISLKPISHADRGRG